MQVDPLDTNPPLGLGPMIRIIAGVMAVFFIGFGGWAAFMPLESAAIAQGVVIVESNRKTIQHLEGGIIAQINVDDGDRVKAGDVLVVLDKARSGAEAALLRGRLASALARRDRLVAERDRKDAVSFDAEIQKLLSSENDRNTLIDGELAVFRERRNFIESQTALNQQKILQLKQEINGLSEEITAADRKLQLITQEISALSGLVEKGLARRPALLQLQRESADISGERGRNISAVARARQQIGEAELTIVDLRTRLLNEVVTELRDTEAEIADLRERAVAANDIERRSEIVAPVDGIIVNKQVFTTGGVVAPGAPLLDIVPTQDGLTVEARVQPNDIDVVHTGLAARVRLSAFRMAENPILAGTVTTVSADALVDPNTNQSYFLARIRLDDLSSLPKDSVVLPGMPAEVMIITGERTMLQYLVEPITLTLSRAMRES
ncbi:MAG: HlyD family type I secretion periplasmic adaptor subunit [Pseudomonadota bacterium]|nr:HlyD family type I secretion periplasmic adaptor subunit [Pseudomonadota bacterium]